MYARAMTTPSVPVPGLEEAIQKSKPTRDALRPRATQPWWNRHLKQALAVVVIGCGAALPMLSPTADAVAFKTCSWVMAVGAGLGITSTGNQKK